MKRLTVGFFILVMILTACAPPTPAADQSSIIIEQPTKGSTDMTPAQVAALTLLSKTLDLPANQITLVSTEPVTWPDGCLGVERPGVMCTQALVEGFRITFDADGKSYEIHTDKKGSAVEIASSSGGGNSLIEDVVVRQLAANLGLDTGKITIVSNESVEFGDSCLGVAMQDVMCGAVITPGRIVVLEAGGIQYEYHTSEDGTLIQPATLALTWSREGGIAGFCDSLTVFLSGEVYGNQCRSQPNGAMDTLSTLLSDDERALFNDWVAQFGQINADASDPEGVSDRMVVLFSFYGLGTQNSISSPESQELLQFAQLLYQELYK